MPSPETSHVETAVLLLLFNRPEPTRRVFDVIRAVRPTRLYVAADGPRTSHPEDPERCDEVRRVATSVDWPCEVRTLFRTTNLGLRAAVTEALDWFFRHETAGVILEDDCLPDPTFFRFCSELLDRYADDERVMVISGDDYHPPDWPRECSYSFTRYPFIWGWATWRRAWRHNDPSMTDWPERRRSSWLLELGDGHRDFAAYWTDRFDDVASDLVDSWAYVWMYSCWVRGGLSIMPTTNLVQNIGYGQQATHTTVDDWRAAHLAAPMAFPLRHPGPVERDPRLDRWADRHVYNLERRASRLLLRRLADASPPFRRVLKSVRARRG